MSDNRHMPDGRDPDSRTGIFAALCRAFRTEPDHLMIDSAADAAFASSLAALRGERGTNRGKAK